MGPREASKPSSTISASRQASRLKSHASSLSHHASQLSPLPPGPGSGSERLSGRMIFVQVCTSGPLIGSEIPLWPRCAEGSPRVARLGPPSTRLPVLDEKIRPSCSNVRSRSPTQTTPVQSPKSDTGPGSGLDRGSGREIFVQVCTSGPLIGSEIPLWPRCAEGSPRVARLGPPSTRLPVLDEKIRPSCSNVRSRSPTQTTPVQSPKSDTGPGSGLDRGSGREIFVQVCTSGPLIGSEIPLWPRCAEGSPRVARLRGTRDQAAGPGRKDPSVVFQRTIPFSHTDHASTTPKSAGPGSGLDRGSGREIFVQVCGASDQDPSLAPMSEGSPRVALDHLRPGCRSWTDPSGVPTYDPVLPHRPRQYNLPNLGSGFGSGSRVRARDFRSGLHIGAFDRIRDPSLAPMCGR